MIKLCIFDLDGTLMDTLGSIAYFVNYTMAELGLESIETEKFKYFAGDGRAELLHRSLAYNNSDTEECFLKACKIYDKAYEGNTMHLTKVFGGIKEELLKLKNSGRKIAVLSNKPHTVTQSVINKTFGEDFFDYVQGQTPNITMKPDPAGLTIIAQKFDIQPEECVMVGDTNVDMLTGKNAGANSLGVLWGFRERKELEENGATKVIDTPDMIFDSISKM